MTQGNDWAQGWADTIGGNLKRLRRDRGVSAQQLSDRCATLGYPIARNTIANIENSRKRDVPVQEVAVLAAALGAAPVEILFPIQDGSTEVEVLPNRGSHPVLALEWFGGSTDKIGAEYIGDSLAIDEWLPVNRDDGGSDLALARAVFRLASMAVSTAESLNTFRATAAALNDGIPVDLVAQRGQQAEGRDWGFLVQTAEEQLDRQLKALQEFRSLERSRGMDPGPVPAEISELYSSIGGDDAQP